MSDVSRRAIMLQNAQSFSDGIVRMYSEGSFDSLDGSERDAVEKYSRMISEKDQSFNAEFRYFQIENDIENLILDLNSEAKWSGFAEKLDASNYFERMSSESKAGLRALIAHIEIEALRHHPWLAIPVDDEELLEA